MRYGITVPAMYNYAYPAVLAQLAAEAESVGWDGFFVWDDVAGGPDAPPIADPWITLAAIAVGTRRIHLGPMVAVVPRSRPWKLARETVALDKLWFSRRQVCEYLWYRREPIERDRLLPADRLAERHGMETIRLWYATGLLAPCRDRTDARRIRWWYDDWEVSRRNEGQLPERLGPGVDLSNAYIWKPGEVLEWRDRWDDSRQALRYLDRYGVRDANEERLVEWVREGRLSCRVEPGVESGAEVRWYPREEVEELQRRLYIERYALGGA